MSPVFLQYLHALPGLLASVVIILGSVSTICTVLAALVRGVNAFAKSPKVEAVAAGLDRGGIAFKGAQAKTELVATKVTTVETKISEEAPK